MAEALSAIQMVILTMVTSRMEKLMGKESTLGTMVKSMMVSGTKD